MTNSAEKFVNKSARLDQLKLGFFGAVQKVFYEGPKNGAQFIQFNTFLLDHIGIGISVEEFEGFFAFHFSFTADNLLDCDESEEAEHFESFIQISMDLIEFLLDESPEVVYNVDVIDDVMHYFVSPPQWWYNMRN
jgi:hypothetical protein